MLLFLAGIIIDIAILLAVAFILGGIMPSVPNKLYRFIFLFVFSVPLVFIINYVDVWACRYHKMAATGALIIAFLLAAYGTFLPPQSRNSNTP
jgi:hypothetical protein